MANPIPLPCAFLAKYGKEAEAISRLSGEKRSIWACIDELIQEFRHKKLLEKNTLKPLEWPESVLVPFYLWGFFLEKLWNAPVGSVSGRLSPIKNVLQTLSCITAWRPTQDIVKFDPDVEAEIREMDLSGNLPAEILKRLPAWCVYVDVPVSVEGDDYPGFFVQLDIVATGMVIAMTFYNGNSFLNRIEIPLGDHTLEKALEIANMASMEYSSTSMDVNDAGIKQALNFVIYICSYGLLDKNDYTASDKKYPRPEKTKKGYRIFAPNKPSIHTLGQEFGEIIRKGRALAARKIGSTGAKRPHIRRAHWHHFWTGPIDNKVLINRFLPPMRVGDAERYEKRMNVENPVWV